MKTFLLFMFAGTAMAAFGAPFGSLVEPHEVASGSHKTMYLIDKIAREEPVFLCVDGRLDKYSLSKEQIDSALNSWFRHAYKSVVRAKRQQEFQDLRPILSKGAQIQLQNCQNNSFFQKRFSEQIKNGSGTPDYQYAARQEDLRLILVDEEDISDGRSYFSEGAVNSAPYIVWSANDRRGPDGLDVLRHELGHALSLSDQYQESLLNSVAEYGTSDTMPAMMNDGDKFTCDDVDGLIFALDCIAQKNTARGGAEGWRSFCPQRAGRNYAYCKTKNREDLLWVSDDTVRYARYDRQGNLTVHKEWDRINDFRLFSLYPNGIPPMPAQLQTVYKGKYVSYKKDNANEYLFSTHPEKGDIYIEPGQTLIVRTDSNYSVVLIKDQNGLTIPLKAKEFSFNLSLNKKRQEITARTQVPSSKSELFIFFSYTPDFRFEYYSHPLEGEVIFMFPKDSTSFYVFFTPDSLPEVHPAQGAKGKLPADNDDFPPAHIYPITAEQAKPFTQKVLALDRYVFDDTPLSEDFLLRNRLAQEAWDLHKQWRKFFEGTIQNWMPGSLSGGFTSPDTAPKAKQTQTQQQITQRVTSRLQRKK